MTHQIVFVLQGHEFQSAPMSENESKIVLSYLRSIGFNAYVREVET